MPMPYEVLITARAERELKAATDWIAERALESAGRWFRGFVQSILRLADNPYQCPVSRESERFPIEIREMLYGRRRSYRAIYTIRQDTVVVLSIRHAARDDLTLDELT